MFVGGRCRPSSKNWPVVAHATPMKMFRCCLLVLLTFVLANEVLCCIQSSSTSDAFKGTSSAFSGWFDSVKSLATNTTKSWLQGAQD